MIKRQMVSNINRLKKGFPVIAITGPRQSGKTTLLKEIFSDYEYFNLENPETLFIIENDPAGFINAHKHKVIIDEVQRIPDLLSYIQSVVDEQKIMGNFIISGSENLLLSEKINQSLAGRVAYVQLFPLSNQELFDSKLLKSSVYSQIFTGFYPALYDRDLDVIDYYDQYISTYAERDLKQISNIFNLSLFRKFFALLAGRIGQLLNLTSLANDVGVSAVTIENWISILEASYLVLRLQPHYNNFGKRHIKASKLYFTDVGLACRLLKITSAETLKQHYLIGGLFENLVIMEIKKYLASQKKSANLYFFRNSNGNEVDLIIDQGINQIPIEIKSSGTFNADFLKGIRYWAKLTGDSNKIIKQRGFVIYAGEQFHKGEEYSLLRWNNLDNLFNLIK